VLAAKLALLILIQPTDGSDSECGVSEGTYSYPPSWPGGSYRREPPLFPLSAPQRGNSPALALLTPKSHCWMSGQCPRCSNHYSWSRQSWHRPNINPRNYSSTELLHCEYTPHANCGMAATATAPPSKYWSPVMAHV
jgi:hypothetical protein